MIQQKVEENLSDALLAGEFKDCEAIIVDVEDDEIVLRRGEGEAELSTEAVAAG